QRQLSAYRLESNPVASFLTDHCETDPAGRVGRQALYHAYRTWAVTNGFGRLSVTRFNREVRALYPQPDEEVRDGHGGAGMLRGMRMNTVETDIIAQFADLARGQTEGQK